MIGAQLGPYRVLHQIGEGGMGSIWLAEHAMLGRRAAIKVLHAAFSHQDDLVSRFFNEARAATAIADPGIVQVYDLGHHDGSAFIVMELLEGEPLDRRLARAGRLAVRDALRIMRQVASALAAAHARGIVHRDLKPENIFLARDPEVTSGERAKLLDFGVAKLTGVPAAPMTQAYAVLGTPVYMSPEQCRGAGGVDHRTDIYAVGCVLFALLTGAPPFAGSGFAELVMRHLTEDPPAPSSRNPAVPPEVDRLVLRCLAKEPRDRYATAHELALAIGMLVGHSRPPICDAPTQLDARALPASYVPPAPAALPASSAPRASFAPPAPSIPTAPLASYVPPGSSAPLAPRASYAPAAPVLTAPLASYAPPGSSVPPAPRASYAPLAPYAPPAPSALPPAPLPPPRAALEIALHLPLSPPPPLAPRARVTERLRITQRLPVPSRGRWLLLALAMILLSTATACGVVLGRDVVDRALAQIARAL